MDLSSAEMLAREAPLEFEKWAITRIPGLVPNQVQVGDGGLDGRGMIYPNDGLVLAQVKGGKSVPIDHVRAFLHVIKREEAKCGVFTTLRPVSSPSAKTEFSNTGNFTRGVSEYPRAPEFIGL